MRYSYPSSVTPDPANPAAGALAQWDDLAGVFTDLVTGQARRYTEAELAAAAVFAAASRVHAAAADLEDQALKAIDGNDTYLKLASPTAAQAIAQVGRLTRQVTTLIRLALREYS